MSAPRRIQRKRTKGWQMPDGAVYVGRPTKWGNPFLFRAAEEAGYTRHGAVRAFEDWLAGNPWACGSDKFEAKRQAILDSLPELRGRDLACWCPLVDEKGNPVPCHADVLLEIANR